MLKKILATLLIVSLSTVYANQINAEKKTLQANLAQSFDNLNYKLNVEWNQKDAGFFNDSMDEFQAQIADLQSEGLTNEELVDYTMSNIKDDSAKAEVKKLAEVINAQGMSSEEAREFAVRNLNNTYSHGASWSGGRSTLKIALLVVAVIVLIQVTSSKDDSTPTPSATPTPTPTPTPSPSPSPSYNPCFYPPMMPTSLGLRPMMVNYCND